MDFDYNKAFEAYDDCLSFLKRITGEYAEFCREKNIEYNPKVTLNQFDVLLQFSLLQIATVDHQLDQGEADFIRNLSHYYDVCLFISREVNRNITWNVLLNSSETLTRFVNDPQVIHSILEISEDFINIFSAYDAITDVDCLEALKNWVTFICYATAISDGKLTREEEKVPCVIYQVINTIEERRKVLKDDVHGNHALGREITDIFTESLINDNLHQKCNYRQKKNSALVYIESETGSGSGFLVTHDGKAVTCYHVIHGAKELNVRVESCDGARKFYPAKIIFEDEDTDLGIIQLQGVNDTSYYEIETNYQTLDSGSDIAIFGFPFGRQLNNDILELEPSITKGYIASKNKIGFNYCYYLDASAAPGFSGGPVFLLETGNVVGYLCGSYGNDRSNITYMRSLELLMKSILK